MRPDRDDYRNNSSVEKTKFRFKCIQRDVRWRYALKRNAQRTWVSWIGCSIRNAKTADTASHARFAIYTVGRDWWESKFCALVDVQQIDHFHFLSAQKCRSCDQEQEHWITAGHISIVMGQDDWRNIPIALKMSRQGLSALSPVCRN